MAAAYAALVSLTHTIDQIIDTPPTLHIIVDRKQIEILKKKADLLLDFLENYTSTRGDQEIEHLEMMIGDAAYAAEYIIEFNVMNQILGRSSADREESSNLLFEAVELSIQEFLFIEKELVKFNKDMQRPNNYYLTTKASSSSSSRPLLLAGGKNTLVGFDNHINEIMGELSTDESNLRIISIVGMGGIGKTTLATNVFNNPFIVEHFQLRAWFTVSQEYTSKEILLGLLHQINNTYRNVYEIDDDDDDDDEDDDYEIGDRLHKTLFGRKYLIVMDDMWDIKVWDMVKRFLPDNSNGSRILVTTRLMKLAADIRSCSPYQLNLLEKSQSWDLLRENIFVEERCPVELEVIGKSIAKKCKGLPLALVVIAGVLAMSKTEEHWVSIEKDVTSAVNNQDGEFCIKILLLSYNNLPIHLKPCFLYFTVFPEDHIIKVSRLVRLWVAEGFIRKCGHKSLEEIGEEYLMDLIHRNLILVKMRWIIGEVRTCRIHDLLSNLCKREAQKNNFIRSFTRKLYKPNILTYMKITPRLSINGGKWKGTKDTLYTSQVPTRSLLCFSKWDSTDYNASRFPLLRLFDVIDEYPRDEILQLINSRYVACKSPMLSMPSSISRLWSLQTLVVDGGLSLPSEIWQMPQLRHVVANYIILPDLPPPDDVHKITLLGNLQTLSTVKDFKCTEAVINRIPNVRMLKILCETIGSNCLSNLGLLHKLEQLYLKLIIGTRCGREIVFPSSLNELTLNECKIPWEDMSVVGSLPNLEILKLWRNATTGQKWIPEEGEFTRLKFLWIHKCELEIWKADNTHFPCLEKLHLGYLNLKEIPPEFAEIVQLQIIGLEYNRNNDLIFASANEISEQRENLGYDALYVLRITAGWIKIWVKRGVNLAVGDGDPYVVITMANQIFMMQSVETRVVKKGVNPKWDEVLTFHVVDPSHPVSLTVRGYNKLSNMDNKMGDAVINIKPLVKASWVQRNGLRNGTIITRILPSSSNCLSKESSIVWKNGRVIQDMCLRLENAECGQVKLQLQWIDK